jgi:hypothetical protein
MKERSRLGNLTGRVYNGKESGRAIRETDFEAGILGKLHG